MHDFNAQFICPSCNHHQLKITLEAIRGIPNRAMAICDHCKCGISMPISSDMSEDEAVNYVLEQFKEKFKA